MKGLSVSISYRFQTYPVSCKRGLSDVHLREAAYMSRTDTKLVQINIAFILDLADPL